MSKQEKSRQQKIEAFDLFMSNIYFPGWSDLLTPDQILFHWQEFLACYPLPFKNPIKTGAFTEALFLCLFIFWFESFLFTLA
jgi:hypothetical protein